MVLARWTPFNVLTLPSLLEGWSGGAPTSLFRAPMDVRRTDGGYRVEAALPGFKPEEIEVTLENGTLTVSARRSQERKDENGRYLRREVYAGSFQRRLSLPARVTADDVTATYENGILSVDVKFDPAADAVKIPVGAGAQQPELPAQATESA